MEYRIKKNQFWRKKLPVPAYIQALVYANSLTIEQMLEYDLIDKVPTTVMLDSDRFIVERLGFDKLKEIDWELIEKHPKYRVGLMLLERDSDDINKAFYQYILERERPSRISDCTPKMIETMSDYFIEDLDLPDDFKSDFYAASLSIESVIQHWDQLKDKKIKKCWFSYLEVVTEEMLRSFMDEYGDVANAIINASVQTSQYDSFPGINTVIYSLYSSGMSKGQRDEYLKKHIHKLYERNSKNMEKGDYAALDKYAPILEYFVEATKDSYRQQQLIESLDGMTLAEVAECGIPPKILIEHSVTNFLEIAGIRNVAEFNRDNNRFFENDDYAVLRSLYFAYLHYGNDYFNVRINEEGINVYDRTCTPEEFEELILRLIQHGPTNADEKEVGFNYSKIVGEFREKHSDIFLDDSAPEELKKLFYTNRLTTEVLVNNPSYFEYLVGKNLGICLKHSPLLLTDDKNNRYATKTTVNLYEHLTKMVGSQKTLEMVFNMGGLLNLAVYDSTYRYVNYNNQVGDFELDVNADIDEFMESLDEYACKVIEKTRYPYDSTSFGVLKEKHPDYFIDDSAPEELKQQFYSRKLTCDYLNEHPEFAEYLKDVNVLATFDPIVYHHNERGFCNLVEELHKIYGNERAFELLIAYGHILEIGCANRLLDINMNKNLDEKKFINDIENSVYKIILQGQTTYKDNMPDSFKEKYPSLFLPKDTPIEIKQAFYNRQMTIEMIKNDMEILKYFKNTDIALGFPLELSWLAGTFDGIIDEVTTMKKLKILAAYDQIQDISLRKIFAEHVKEHVEETDVNQLETLKHVLSRLSFSNSSEMLKFRAPLAAQILASDNPKNTLDKVEEIFLTNNIPLPGKVYSVFQILHPHCAGFRFDENSRVSPVLANAGRSRKDAIIFSDLLRISLGSNNRSMRDYLISIEQGNKLFLKISSGELKIEDLDEVSLHILKEYAAHLCALYNNTLASRAGKKKKVSLSDDLVEDINNLIFLFSTNGELDYNLPDRIVQMFGHFADIESFEQIKTYFIEKRLSADIRNRSAANGNFTLEPGDLVKGINDFKYLGNILQNGSVAKEFLGDSSTSDATPLDTDLSMVYESGKSLKDTLSKTEATNYGNIWLVLKRDDRFQDTRSTVKSPIKVENPDLTHNPNKLELFYTGMAGGSHYGIRTGFASSEINYIIVGQYNRRVGLEIVKNGFYIPVVDKEGNLVFTVQDYENLRNKMRGLSYYDADEFVCSDYLAIPEAVALAERIYESDIQTAIKRNAINSVISNAVESMNLILKGHIDGDLTEGTVELIDTGSTGRGTNMPGDGDFDFMMRLDKSIFTNPVKLTKLKEVLIDAFGSEHAKEIIGSGDFRLKGVRINGLETPVDIDITFVEKTNKLSYSTDMSLQDRLRHIKAHCPIQYDLVIANILIAKKVLKESGIYKPNRGEVPQGGLGGVGVENWILQNGGSFVEAAKSFLACAEGRDFEAFKAEYQLWDFGENHLAAKKEDYPHDNFITRNMSAEGYVKMCEALKNYLNNLQYEDTKKISF